MAAEFPKVIDSLTGMENVKLVLMLVGIRIH